MKKGKVFFHPVEGSAPLTISWSSASKGDALEAQNGIGVGFFSEKGDLLCVVFDDVKVDDDQQLLQFENYFVEIHAKEGRVKYALKSVGSEKISQTTSTLQLFWVGCLGIFVLGGVI